MFSHLLALCNFSSVFFSLMFRSAMAASCIFFSLDSCAANTKNTVNEEQLYSPAYDIVLTLVCTLQFFCYILQLGGLISYSCFMYLLQLGLL